MNSLLPCGTCLTTYANTVRKQFRDGKDLLPNFKFCYFIAGALKKQVTTWTHIYGFIYFKNFSL